MKNVFVTGITGLLGTNLVIDLLENNEGRKETPPKAKLSAGLIGRELPGFGVTPKSSRTSKWVNRLYANLTSRRKISKGQRVDLGLWESQFDRYIKQNAVDINEFDMVLNWWCDHVG